MRSPATLVDPSVAALVDDLVAPCGYLTAALTNDPIELAAAPAPVRIHYYEADDSVFVDNDYLIRGVAGRILWLVLSQYTADGRSTFSNRELRLHPFLKLPSWKDNLETRLLRLQRRCRVRTTAFRLDREQRGELRITCNTPLQLIVL